MRTHLRNKLEDKNLIEQGFTLIELLIVIVILGILAAVVVFAVGNIGDKGQASSCDTDKQTILTAIEAYRAADGNSATATPTMAELSGDGGFLSKDSGLYEFDTPAYDATGKPQLVPLDTAVCPT